MEKLHIRLENENLRPQLDWIIDNASSANFNYPPVIFYHLILICFVLIQPILHDCFKRNFGNTQNCYGKIGEYNSALKDRTNIS